jgi:hypothetical protein
VPVPDPTSPTTEDLYQQNYRAVKPLKPETKVVAPKAIEEEFEFLFFISD